MNFLKRLSGYKTYIALWAPVLLTLGALLGVHLDPSWLVTLAKHGVVASEPAGWIAWLALVARAADQTFMRLGVKKAAFANVVKDKTVLEVQVDTTKAKAGIQELKTMAELATAAVDEAVAKAASAHKAAGEKP